MAEKTVGEVALIELLKHVRILQRQMKLMKGMKLNQREREMVKDIMGRLMKETELFRM